MTEYDEDPSLMDKPNALPKEGATKKRKASRSPLKPDPNNLITSKSGSKPRRARSKSLSKSKTMALNETGGTQIDLTFPITGRL